MIIYRYTRTQTSEDGELVDINRMAKKVGFLYPVSISHRLLSEYIIPARELLEENDVDRLWELLSMLSINHKIIKNPGSCVWFTVSFLMVIDGKQKNKDINLKSVVTLGNARKPEITVMLCDED
jgi:hypothetical protein